ncbi:YoaK family protein [Asticcacaulis sp. 201]|uniref:YoaK family protein n=1 Tax=Asticcacaulis sp. 201 TaxID=3028787 RepID=UPI0029170F83|nr:DUF1275 family protein [Asticcacaulis sp. 201]MDV6333052.1 DUF1275 family protein [Asticcacaulis sp. 201]
MNTLQKRAMALAVGLSSLAGFVDATGFLELHGTFISFMSGNSTQLAVALSHGEAGIIAGLATIIGLFMFGVFIGTLAGHFAYPAYRTITVMGLVTGLIGAGWVCHLAGVPLVAIACLTLAMGAENAVFQRRGDVVVGVTYMTGTLVKVSQKLAIAVTGGDRWAWGPWLVLWGGLILGGIAGATAYRYVGLGSIAVAVVWAAALTVYAWLSRAAIHDSLQFDSDGAADRR